MQAFYLTPESLFPRGLASNTIFGAVCAVGAELGYDIDGLIARYLDDPPFLLSSGFPCVHHTDGTVSHFFPVPITPPYPVTTKAEYIALKAYKKVRYVGEEEFRNLCGGEITVADLITGIGSRYHIHGGICTADPAATDFIQGIREVPHNQINRRSMASEQFYHTEGAFYGSARDGLRSGLFFLAEFGDPAWEQPFTGAMRLLEDRGFGQKKSSGAGKFHLTTERFESLPQEGRYRISLSRFIPNDLREFGEEIWYDLVSARGRSADGVMKKQVFMLSEGTTFAASNGTAVGKVVHVRGTPPAVEYGMALTCGWEGFHG
ncbi:MAG TPA: type III-A CRISPR-associated RAMP protein Csm4 [Methanoculleus sp.]|nr:type III-A CRISPR-associated RAMP protein Csm4 [Methanoculleus sp.]